jgi:hypothetical protein
VTRTWDEFVAAVFDVVSAQQVLLLLFLAATLTAVLWYWFPAWVPRRLPRWRLKVRRPRWRVRLRLRRPHWTWRWLLFWRRCRAPKAEPAVVAVPPEDTVPIVPAAPRVPVDLTAADRLAAEGRYAEAIRQRLRDVVDDLISAGAVAPQPGWTAEELTAVAAATRPGVAGPLGAATALFSEIWYGRRPALPGHDDRMRALAGEVRAALRPGPGGAR